MLLVIAHFEDTPMGATYTVKDADGKTQATIVAWAADVVAYSRRRWSVYRVRGGCDMSDSQFGILEQFVSSRLASGLGIDGVGIEV